MRLAGTPHDLRRIESPGFLLSGHYPLAPPRCSILRASTPSCSEELPLGRRYQPTTSCSVFAVSHHLDGFLRAMTAGLLRPAASLEVRHVFQESQLVSPEGAPAVESGPRDAVHTLQRVSLISSRAASLQSFPSYRSTPTTTCFPPKCSVDWVRAPMMMLRLAETNPHITLAVRWDTEVPSRCVRSLRLLASQPASSRLDSMGTRRCSTRRSVLHSLTEVGSWSPAGAVTTRCFSGEPGPLCHARALKALAPPATSVSR
jgi:hypothetical protein